MTSWRGWWPGQTVDHMYERCPLRPAAGDRVDSDIDPEGGDVCGWCARVWRAAESPKITKLTPAPPLGDQEAPLDVPGGAPGPGKRQPSVDAGPPLREGTR